MMKHQNRPEQELVYCWCIFLATEFVRCNCKINTSNPLSPPICLHLYKHTMTSDVTSVDLSPNPPFSLTAKPSSPSGRKPIKYLTWTSFYIQPPGQKKHEEFLLSNILMLELNPNPSFMPPFHVGSLESNKTFQLRPKQRDISLPQRRPHLHVFWQFHNHFWPLNRWKNNSAWENIAAKKRIKGETYLQIQF